MYNPESVLENQMRKFLWDLGVQTDYQISYRRPDLVIVNDNKKRKKKTWLIVDFVASAEHSVKFNGEKRDKDLELARDLKKLWNMIPIVIGALGTITKGLVKATEDLKFSGQVETICNVAVPKII